MFPLTVHQVAEIQRHSCIGGHPQERMKYDQSVFVEDIMTERDGIPIQGKYMPTRSTVDAFRIKHLRVKRE